MSERVSYTVENHIAHIKLTRADKMNALDTEMVDSLIAAGERLKNDPDVRCAIISGDGKAFCAGLDLSNFAKMSESGDSASERKPLAERTHGIANRMQQVAWVWRQVPVPVIAVAHGVAIGGGFQIYLGSDIRYAAPKTKFSIMEIKWGLVPDMGTTHVMSRVIREDILKELAMTGRIFEAEEALNIGCVTKVCEDPIASAFETASYIATRNPIAIRSTKRLFNEPADRFVEDTLMLEATLQDEIIGKPNQIEAVKAEMEKRAANFS
jgi:enoyl-CoA hydratase/carnithine racemase